MDMKKSKKAMNKEWEAEEIDHDEDDTPLKRKIQQSDGAKKMIADPWSTVPHRLLSSRKITVGNKTKNKKIQEQKITSVRNFFKKNSNIAIEATPLAQRKVKRIDLLSQTLPQVIKTTLKDYNSITFKARVS
jgi:hypothetical protein